MTPIIRLHNIVMNEVISYRYIKETYSQFHSFMDGTASQEIDNFLKSGEQELSFFAKVIIIWNPSWNLMCQFCSESTNYVHKLVICKYSGELLTSTLLLWIVRKLTCSCPPEQLI